MFRITPLIRRKFIKTMRPGHETMRTGRVTSMHINFASDELHPGKLSTVPCKQSVTKMGACNYTFSFALVTTLERLKEVVAVKSDFL